MIWEFSPGTTVIELRRHGIFVVRNYEKASERKEGLLCFLLSSVCFVLMIQTNKPDSQKGPKT